MIEDSRIARSPTHQSVYKTLVQPSVTTINSQT
ncbi:hypothetical protein F441_08062 [Phytophthora nicotianae CJ01A1]|uniref:Uncharacterized protein n=4 Tax=Phytophthora nicotianae TaxID=4792 RepID=W2Q935_PHYN3|nr:hypothetical protein PPTG_22819 [Phytophthora nicotianae INRA-310]ETI47816.1 hypothetical protein F443_08090 [Phytophthora nicotianae P1569]ETN09693.1 hypothetical protein PPTG_22819 [Phytophthora nicotianae INRA-310]ETO76467.1 hypothetical protein F444_08136 [Phytophthora nicotianae P1976]ETP17549.1 hypothetical protein F441_08062 [Phytophthora nicotianae CJ01A1]